MILSLGIFIILPLSGFVLSLLVPSKKEKLISFITFSTFALQFLTGIVFLIQWMKNGHHPMDQKALLLFKTTGYEFYIELCFDKVTAVFLFTGSLLAFLVALYSKYYLHRENGYKRFFNVVLFFFIGYNITIFSGNFETMYIGWEIIAISSFLLIAFYRERYLPVKNALKVFFIYRIADVGLVLAIWMSHHLWNESISFQKMYLPDYVHSHLHHHGVAGLFISFMILLSATTKSAQLPFSSWLPRAMEGPTPSSAIFYGSLAVHLGALLLIRTMPLWDQQMLVKIAIVSIGALTAIIATGIARVQSSVKSQIAYSSIAQIGLMFIEIAFGFTTLALIHFAGNAFLRTYQLLVSPSVVSYLIKDQFYNYDPDKKTAEHSFPTKLRNTLYILCVKEWNLDAWVYKYLWRPLKWTGREFEALSAGRMLVVFIPLFVAGLVSLYYQSYLPYTLKSLMPVLFSLVAFLMVCKSFAERKNVMVSWIMVLMNHFWLVLALSFNEHITSVQIILYLSGMVAFGFLGYICLYVLKTTEHDFDMNKFYGYSGSHPVINLCLLLACLGLSGFPVTPSFIGEDLLFTHIHEDQPFLAFFVSLSLVVDSLAAMRIYSRLFFGPDLKSGHEIAYKSS